MRIHSTIMTKRKSKCFENIRNAIFLSPVFVDVFVRLINYSKLLGKWSKNNLVWKSPWYGYMYYIPGYMYICSWITLNDLVNTHLDLSGLNQGGGGASLLSWRRDQPFLGSVNRDVWKPVLWISDWSALRDTWTTKILECFDLDIEDQSNKKKII